MIHIGASLVISVVKNLPAKKKIESACQSRRHVFDPWSWKIPLGAEQLSPLTTTIEPVLFSHNCRSLCTLELMLHSKRSPQYEKPKHHHN